MRIWDNLAALRERLVKVDWAKILLTIFKLSKRSGPKIDPRFLEVKPRILSDENLLKGLAALKVVLGAIPPTALAAHALSLGDAGFRLWKRIALSKGYEGLSVDPVGRNTIKLFFLADPVLAPHFEFLVSVEDWEELYKAFDDFRFVTEPEILQAKYPAVLPDYIESVCETNRRILGDNLAAIEQVIVEHKHLPLVDQNIRGALEGLKGMFPSMRSWSMMESDTFNEVVDIIDTLV